jgi:hypothetical protein
VILESGDAKGIFYAMMTLRQLLSADVKIGVHTEISTLSYLEIHDPGVFVPGKVEVHISNDGEHFEKVLSIANDILKDQKGRIMKEIKAHWKENKPDM